MKGVCQGEFAVNCGHAPVWLHPEGTIQRLPGRPDHHPPVAIVKTDTGVQCASQESEESLQ
jgi:hypothetical protein